jgi:NADPH-dependent 7-cyano-7-deazaguanine reductase QueF
MLIILFSPTKKINKNNFISDGTFANNVFCFNIIIKFLLRNIEFEKLQHYIFFFKGSHVFHGLLIFKLSLKLK